VSTEWTTISSLATAGGTLVLGVATFAAVRSANRAARVAERSFQIGLRPILVPSRLEDAPQKIMYSDHHWATLKGGRAVVEVVDDVVYLAMQIRNVGNGMAIIESWDPFPAQRTRADEWNDIGGFRPQTRDLLVPPGDVAFWQGALREPSEKIHREMVEAISEGAISIDLLYLDHEGGQQTISRFSLIRRDEDPHGESGPSQVGEWWVSLSIHRTLGHG
jgi:hypothetical protein